MQTPRSLPTTGPPSVVNLRDAGRDRGGSAVRRRPGFEPWLCRERGRRARELGVLVGMSLSRSRPRLDRRVAPVAIVDPAGVFPAVNEDRQDAGVGGQLRCATGSGLATFERRDRILFRA